MILSSTRPLAELHLHLEGSINYADFLDYITQRDIDWSRYEAGYQHVYGQIPPIRDILAGHWAGDIGAVEQFKRIFVFGDEDAGDFERFQAKFDVLIYGSLCREAINNPETFPAYLQELRHFCHKIIANQRRQGIRYAEHRTLIGEDALPEYAKAIALTILSTFAEYETSGFSPRLAISLPRDNPWCHWEMIQELALGPLGRFVTGVDFCHFEEGYPPKNQAAFFKEVQAFNQEHPERALAILYHVGESFKDKSLQSAIRWVHEAAQLGAHRLGHAIALGIDPEAFANTRRTETVEEHIDQLQYDLQNATGLREYGVPIDRQKTEVDLASCRALPPRGLIDVEYDSQALAEIKARQLYAIEQIKRLGAVVEVCPTSNKRIGNIQSAGQHPIHTFLKARLPFVIASDDPGIFDTTIGDEIDWVVRTANLGPDRVEELIEASWRYRSEILTGREEYVATRG